MAQDSKGGFIGTVDHQCDLESNAPICYINKELESFKISENGKDFLSKVESWQDYMKPYDKIVLILFLLTGCIGEEYDFSPPTVSVYSPDGINYQEDLAEANIDWNYDEKYNKETKDIQSLAEKQNKIYFNSGELVVINLEDGDFDPDGISVSVWQEDIFLIQLYGARAKEDDHN